MNTLLKIVAFLLIITTTAYGLPSNLIKYKQTHPYVCSPVGSPTNVCISKDRSCKIPDMICSGPMHKVNGQSTQKPKSQPMFGTGVGSSQGKPACCCTIYVGVTCAGTSCPPQACASF